MRNSHQEQAETGRSNAEHCPSKRPGSRRAGQELARESVEAYAQFLDTLLARYVGRYRGATDRAGKRQGEQRKWWILRRCKRASDTRLRRDERQEVSERLDDLSTEELQLLRDYESAITSAPRSSSGWNPNNGILKHQARVVDSSNCG